MRSLAVLSVAFPFASVGPDAVGGAEQVLTQLDYALTRAGHESIVLAHDGSETSGTLISTPAVNGRIEERERLHAHELHRAAIEEALLRWPVDLVHMHGLDFASYLPALSVPVLATLHLPPSWYPPEIFAMSGSNVFLHCVSASQRRACPPGTQLLPDIPNGVPPELFNARFEKREFALVLGRICPEKNIHTAIDAAKRAKIGLLIAGEVFPYAAHQHYFQSEIVPRLDATRRFIGRVGFASKRRLLTEARCLLVPSLARETSSLVAMESLACGTPVIAFPSGALPEIVEHTRTGFIVNDEPEMAQAIEAASAIDSEVCRESARSRFSLDQMISRYFAVYHQLSQSAACHV